MILFIVLGAMVGLTPAIPLVARRYGLATGYVLAAAFVGFGVALIPSLGRAMAGRPTEARITWLPALDVSATLRLDGLSSLFTLLVIGVGALIMAYCPRYLRLDHHVRTYVLLTLFAASMWGLVLSADLVLLFVFWELTALSSFFLIGGTGPHSARPAKRALLITAGGGVALLIAVVLIAVETGTTYLPAILAEPDLLLESPIAWPVGALLIVAAFTKSAQLPFHTWLPGAMVAVTPVSAYLHAATMVKAGIYLVMRFSPVYAAEPAWQATLIGVGLLTAVVAAALALRQHDLKALLAYSTVSQLGLIMAVAGVGTPAAFSAAVLHTFAHALFKATLFMLVGIIDREAGSRDIRELGGLRRVMPITAALTGLAGLSMAGVPPLIGFVSKESIFQGLSEASFAPAAGPTAAAFGVAASALTFGYGVRIFYGAFAGPTTQRQLYEPAWQFLTPPAIPAVLGLVLGPGVAVLEPLTSGAVRVMAPGAAEPHLAFWHGFSPELLLSAVTISIGLVLFAAREPVDRFLNRLRTPPEGEVFERGYIGLVALGAAVGWPSRRGALLSYLVWPVLALVGLAAVALVGLGGWPPAAPGTSGTLDWGVLGLLAVTTLGLLATRRALAAIVLLGTIGLLVSGWFLLAGAPDVALTLLLVETLTAVVAVLVLRSLPHRFRRTRPRRAVPTALLALAAGVAAAAGTLALTGGRQRSALGDYFLTRAETGTGGSNVVNTILVDFRALDTLGEATVLGVAALGVVYLLGRTGAAAPTRDPAGPAAGPRITDGVVYRTTARLLVPGMLLLSAYLFLRGHYAPGGGFIAALVAGTAMAFGWIATGRTGGTTPALRSLRPVPLVAGGLLVCVTTGLAAIPAGHSFLTPLHAEIAGRSLSSSLLFDLGVYLFVLGLVIAAVDRLGATGGRDACPSAGSPDLAVPS